MNRGLVYWRRPGAGKQPIYKKSADKVDFEAARLTAASRVRPLDRNWAMSRSNTSGGTFAATGSISLASIGGAREPSFKVQPAAVVALYVASPERGILLCVMKTSPIQALERAQGNLKLPSCRALTSHSHNLNTRKKNEA